MSLIEEYGLMAALKWYVETTSVRSGASIVLNAEGNVPRFSPEKELAMFRIAQEAVLNAVKHAGASGITVALEQRDTKVMLSVSDNGKGFDPASPSGRGTGWGLSIMRDRAESAGAVLGLKSVPGRGTVVSVELEAIS